MSTALHDILNSLSPGFPKDAELGATVASVSHSVRALEEATRGTCLAEDDRLAVLEALCLLDTILHRRVKHGA